MKVTIISYRYKERRSVNYQSAEATVEATVQLNPEDKSSLALALLKKQARIMLRQDVEEAVAEIAGTNGGQ